ncbi:nuclear pore complex protein DDB_G0274915 [Odontomachus brunneus]|uniref:nuclear pore complex protein DDB_G0274915 n=1 Tax=Odontomachus brunneus TaxID=486640 RepID=UPI0013F248E7|nr:nuclear pore complex protein DDB_G0274915 [Odontomachus brunneus]
MSLVRRATSRSQVLLLRLLLLCTLVVSARPEETIQSWDTLSQLIPTNLVYEKQDRNASPPSNEADASLGHSLDENNVMDISKSKGGGGDEEKELNEEEEPKLTFNTETTEEEYDDEDKQGEEEEEEEEEKEEEEEEEEDSSLSVGQKKSPMAASASDTEAVDNSRDEDYFEDPSTNQYDNTYYYYDEYENGNRSRYKAVDGENLDYPDAESEDEDVTLEGWKDSGSEHETLEKRDEDNLYKSSTASLHILEEGDSDLLTATDLEQGSSMEGSDKSFAFLDSKEKEKLDNTTVDSSILIGEAVVSVVTTKSVVNGTISVPTTSSPSTTEQVAPPPSSEQPIAEVSTEVTTEDSSRILASVQTSRSVSGARFLPFPAVIDRVEQVKQIEHSGSPDGRKTSQSMSESTESIIDKLDWAQSRLSGDLVPAAILSGGFRSAGNTLQLDVLAERERTTRAKFTTTTARTHVIGKFVPRRYSDKRLNHTSTTAKPLLETTLDNLEGLLPRNYVSRGTTPSAGSSKINFRWPSSRQTETTVTISTTPSTTKSTVAFVVQDISAFLPPGYKLKKADTAVTESSVLNDILAKSKVDISSLLPANYDKRKIQAEQDTKLESTTMTTTTTAKSNTSLEKVALSIQDLFASSKVDISALLPKDYKVEKKTAPTLDGKASSIERNTTERTDVDSPTTKKTSGLKIVFPSRPGGRKPIHKITTPQTPRGDGPGAVTPKIQKGWPIRATTEFTGWPTPSTTPISIEKLLEAARTATVTSANVSLIPSTNEISSTSSTSSTTTTTPRPTTPGMCDEECEVAGTIRIIGNATWLPELLDRNTREWQELANQVEREMNFIFSKSTVLTKWYKNIRIDSFSQGSILVDYFVELANLQQKVNTQELKVIFHDSLRTYNSNRWNETSTKGALRMGVFTIDPKYTDFVVIPKVNTPQYIEKDDRLIPQWAIAVIVIGVGGLLFIIVFGVSVLVNRQNGAKLKPAMSTIYEEEVAKHTSSHRSNDYSKPVHTIWTDPDVSWNDKSFESTSNKILVDKPFQDGKKYNLYDSWRSEWNGYYYNPSHTSSKYGGYDSTTNLSSRHHPDYDTNF